MTLHNGNSNSESENDPFISDESDLSIEEIKAPEKVKQRINFDDNSDNDNDPSNYDKDLATGDKAKFNAKIHRRIDEIMEEKRLKSLLDDMDDWSF